MQERRFYEDPKTGILIPMRSSEKEVNGPSIKPSTQPRTVGEIRAEQDKLPGILELTDDHDRKDARLSIQQLLYLCEADLGIGTCTLSRKTSQAQTSLILNLSAHLLGSNIEYEERT